MNFNRKIKVLIVDDSGIFRRVLFNQLKDNPDIDIVGMAKDPYEARDIIIKTSPDVLLLDIMMPGLDGIEFLNILKNKRDIPAIAMSGSSNNETNAIAAGAVDFIEKPTAKTIKYFNETIVQKIKKAAGFNDDSSINIKPKNINNININVSYSSKNIIA
ncbi:MAG: response regulator, partial [Romboutsia sp.]|nr:response regulator [Romboutsia sp.]